MISFIEKLLPVRQFVAASRSPAPERDPRPMPLTRISSAASDAVLAKVIL
jgi:hypothetical protein